MGSSSAETRVKRRIGSWPVFSLCKTAAANRITAGLSSASLRAACRRTDTQIFEENTGRRNADLRRCVARAQQLPRPAISSPRFVIRHSNVLLRLSAKI